MSGATFVDIDNNGLRDLLVARYLTWDFCELACGDSEPGSPAYCHRDTTMTIGVRRLGRDFSDHDNDGLAGCLHERIGESAVHLV